jgi:hypothetical protein
VKAPVYVRYTVGAVAIDVARRVAMLTLVKRIVAVVLVIVLLLLLGDCIPDVQDVQGHGLVHNEATWKE